MLAPGAVYHYRFKILGSGVVKVIWTDAAHADHSVNGPQLKEGDEGSLTVVVHEAKASLEFRPRSAS